MHSLAAPERKVRSQASCSTYVLMTLHRLMLLDCYACIALGTEQTILPAGASSSPCFETSLTARDVDMALS